MKCLFVCLSATKNDHILGLSVCLFVCNVLSSLIQNVCLSVTKKQHFSRRFFLNPLKPHLNSLNSWNNNIQYDLSAEAGKQTWNLSNLLHK